MVQWALYDIYIYIYIYTLKTYESRLKSSYDDVISVVDNVFWLMGFKHSNTKERNVWTMRGIMLKNKPYGHIPWEFLGQSMNFLTLEYQHTHTYIYIYIYNLCVCACIYTGC